MITYDVDAGGTGDYSEIQDAIDVIPASLVDDYTLSLRTSDVSSFIIPVSVPAKTLNGFKIYVIPIPGDKAIKGSYDETKVRLEADVSSSNFAVFYNQCDGLVVDGLQIKNTRTGTEGYCTRVDNAAGTLFKNCRFRVTDGALNGMLMSASASSTKIENTIVENTGSLGGSSEGIFCFSDTVISNSIVNRFNDGYEDDAGVTKAVNCVGINNTTDFDTVDTVDYCMTLVPVGTNHQIPASSDFANEFVDYTSYNYTAKETGNLPSGIGPATDSDVPTADMEGDTRSGATTYIGVDEPGGEVIADPDDLIQGAPVFGSPTISGNEVSFSYSQITAGFSGFFDLLTDVNERRFNVNAIWSGTITGTGATLKTNATSTPYIVIVDGVDTNPTVAVGEIVLFTGLTDTVHDVQFFSRLSFQGSGNGLNINETEILTVTGASPSMVNLPAEYITDPTFAGQSTESHIATPGGNYTPTWEQSQIHDRERGEVIFNAQIDELWVFTSDLDMWLSIDNETPTKVVFSVPNEFSSQEQRRLVKISDILDNSQIHQYTLWYGTRVTYGTQAIVLKNNGALANLESYTDKLVVSFYGDSIIDGSTGATVGEADAYLVGIANNYAIQKAGKNGRTTAELTTDLPGIIAASFVPDVGVLCIGRNDYSNVAGYEPDYSACVDEMVSETIPRIICRGMTPNDDQDARLITMSSEVSDVVDSKADTDITYMFSDNWIPIETFLNDNTHPTATGYLAQVDDWEAEALRGQIKEPAAPENIIHGAPVFGEPTISPELIADPDAIVQGAPVFGEPTISNDSDAIGKITITYGSVLKPYITGESR